VYLADCQQVTLLPLAGASVPERQELSIEARWPGGRSAGSRRSTAVRRADIARLDIDTGRLSWTNAGHPEFSSCAAPHLCGRRPDPRIAPRRPGQHTCHLRDPPGARRPPTALHDGITEARSPHGNSSANNGSRTSSAPQPTTARPRPSAASCGTFSTTRPVNSRTTPASRSGNGAPAANDGWRCSCQRSARTVRPRRLLVAA
jgi:hypothetical protein